MSVYRFVWPTGYAAHMTMEQFDTACLIAEQWGLTHTVTVQPVFGVKDAVGIHTGSMFIAVLPDGSSHS